MVKKLLYLFSIYTLFGMQVINGQNSINDYLVRSTIGVSGSSENIKVDSKNFIIQQSIGQASVIGTFNKDNYSLRQGFIQPFVSAKIIDKAIPLNLEGIIYPNPFVESISVSFTEKIIGKIEVQVFDILGRLAFSKSYLADQNLKVSLPNLAVADYILKVSGNNKQFIKKILKN